jgi:hypothetical protein
MFERESECVKRGERCNNDSPPPSATHADCLSRRGVDTNEQVQQMK